MPSLRDTIRPALFEARFVVLGVVLALAANEGREMWDNRKRSDVALRDITSELRANRLAVGAGEVLYAEMYRAGPASIAGNYRNLASLIGAFAYKERELLARYDSTLTIISSPAVPAIAAAAK